MFLLKTLLSVAFVTVVSLNHIMAMQENRPKEYAKGEVAKLREKKNAEWIMHALDAIKQNERDDTHMDAAMDIITNHIAPILHEVSQVCPVINTLGDIYEAVKAAKKTKDIRDRFEFKINGMTYYLVDSDYKKVLEQPTDTKVRFESEHIIMDDIKDIPYYRYRCNYKLLAIKGFPFFTIEYYRPMPTKQ